MTYVGEVVGGTLDAVIIREAGPDILEAGNLLVWDGRDHGIILQVFGLEHGSQADARTREMMAGMDLGGGAATELYEPGFSDYVLARARPVVMLKGGRPLKPKRMPPVFGKVRRVAAPDLAFLPGPGPGRFLVGHVRSGSSVVEGADLHMDAASVLSHHVLVPATTGRGKSNLVKCMMYGLIGSGAVGALVLDAHGEYYRSLMPHPRAAGGLVCYTSAGNAPPGTLQLLVSVRSVAPHNLSGVVELSEAQERMAWDLWDGHGKEWIPCLLDAGRDSGLPDHQRITRMVLRQKITVSLGLKDGRTFTTREGVRDTIRDIAGHVEAGRIVVVDTSGLGSSVEMMVGSMAASKILWQYRRAADNGSLGSRPVAAVVVEEAPRLLGSGGLGQSNPFATIAKEGRKFKVGICAITQVSSTIQREIMTNLNTKIIFGNEMQAEREALVGSAAQDLSNDRGTIGSLDVGEAIVTSTLVPFAVPIQVPPFEEVAKVRDGGMAGGRARIKVY